MAIFEDFTLTENPINQAPMARYMRNQFPFAGLKTPDRKQQSHDLIQASKKLPVAARRHHFATPRKRDAGPDDADASNRI